MIKLWSVLFPVLVSELGGQLSRNIWTRNLKIFDTGPTWHIDKKSVSGRITNRMEINTPLLHKKRNIWFVKHAWKTHFTNYLPWNCTSTPMGLLNIVYIGEVQFYRGKVYISTMKSLNICLFLLKHFYYLLCPIPLSLCPIQSVSIPNYVIKCYKTKEFNLVL